MAYRLAIFFVLVMLVLASCGKTEDKKPAPPAMKVGVSAVDKGDLEQILEVSGTIHFLANTTVSAEVSAQVQSIEVVDGQLVEAGQLLLIFDSTKIRETANQAAANLQKDEATLTFNKAEWEKNLELYKSNSISKTQYDQKLSAYHNSLAQVEADKAILAKANQDLMKTRVVSPISGVLSNRYVERGDWVSEGGKLFQVSNYRKVYLESFLSDLDVGKLNVSKITSEGIDAIVTVDSYLGKEFLGKLTYIQPVANQARLFQTRIYLDNPDMKLLQGMFARGRIAVKIVPGVIRVPLEALLEQVRENDSNTVFLMDAEKKARLTKIKIGTTDPHYAQVLGGLNPGDVVVIQGKEIISTGQLLAPADLSRT